MTELELRTSTWALGKRNKNKVDNFQNSKKFKKERNKDTKELINNMRC